MQWIQPKRGGRIAGPITDYNFRVSNQSNGGKTNKPSKQAVIALSEKAMKELRWVVGDRVVVAFENNRVHLKRVHKDGFALSSGCGKPKSEVLGKMVAAVFKTCAFNFPVDEVTHIDAYTIKDDVVTFSIK